MRMLEIKSNPEFVKHAMANAEAVAEWEAGRGNGPSIMDIHFDASTAGQKSEWNREIFRLLTTQFKRLEGRSMPPVIKDEHLHWLFFNKYKILHREWTQAQPRIKRNGQLETPGEVQDRRIEKGTNSHARNRNRSRRQRKLERRQQTIRVNLSNLEQAEGEQVALWKWMLTVLNKLDVDGMSSEHTDRADGREILRVHLMQWRAKDIENLLTFLDLQHDTSAAGNPGKQRVYLDDKSIRKAKRQLPKNFYDSGWLQSLREDQRLALSVDQKDFEWFPIDWLAAKNRGHDNMNVEP